MRTAVSLLRAVAGLVLVAGLGMFLLFLTGDCEPQGPCEPLFQALGVLVLIGALLVAAVFLAISAVLHRMAAKRHEGSTRG